MQMSRAKLIMAISSLGLLIALFSLFLFGNGEEGEIVVTVSSPPDASEVLTFNPYADIFQWEDGIYQTEIDWIDALDLIEHEQVGEIKFEATNAEEFKNGAANALPIGAKIYSTHDRHDILIVKYNNKMKRYIRLTEG